MSDVAGIGSAANAAASIAAATLQYRVAKQAQDRLDKLANYQIDNLERDKRRAERFDPAVDSALTTIADEPLVQRQVSSAISRAHAIIEADFARGRRKLRECASIYCAPLSASQVAQLAVAAGVAKAEAATAELRREEVRVRTLNAQILDRKIATVGGATRGRFNEALNSSRLLMDFYSKQSGLATSALSGSVKQLGYLAANALKNFGTTTPSVQVPADDGATAGIDEEIRRQNNQSMGDWNDSFDALNTPGPGGTMLSVDQEAYVPQSGE